jgi:3-deoxy-7-phosphoheptulonate synthase
VHRVDASYKLVSNQWRVEPTVIPFENGASIGGEELQIIAGPCSIESEEQVKEVLKHLSENKIHFMRGGVFKPRTSPYAFMGNGIEALKYFHQQAEEAKIGVVSEVMDVSQIDIMHDYVEIYQVGARTAQNFNLLVALGETDKPILLKRGISGTLDELLHAAEYIFSHGNEKIILCERGIRSFETAYRNVFDINAIPYLKSRTHLPVIADPSHGIGVREFVADVALASVAAGADGVLLEIHARPEEAASDAQQTLNFAEGIRLYSKLQAIKECR